jgi:ornithine carbamoyltransferase
MRHFLDISDHDVPTLRRVLDLAFELRAQRSAGVGNAALLRGKTAALLFEKPSLRTRVSFEQAMYELGGRAIVLSGAEVGIGTRESPADIARVLSGMVHGIVARVFAHQKLRELASHATIPVVNALSDDSHPCQALADLMTLMDEFGHDLTGRTLAFIGDGNNVARSLAHLCARLGMGFVLSCPEGYELEPALFHQIHREFPGAPSRICRDPRDAVRHADAIYTDTFVSMGQESEKARRLQAFKDYQINGDLLAAAPPHAVVLHCLPAYRGVEITDQAMDGPRSRVFPQAHNRLHAQKGLLATLMSEDAPSR